jgi:hypothetical protein
MNTYKIAAKVQLTNGVDNSCVKKVSNRFDQRKQRIQMVYLCVRLSTYGIEGILQC